jgi:hypothetical protein
MHHTGRRCSPTIAMSSPFLKWTPYASANAALDTLCARRRPPAMRCWRRRFTNRRSAASVSLLRRRGAVQGGHRVGQRDAGECRMYFNILRFWFCYQSLHMAKKMPGKEPPPNLHKRPPSLPYPGAIAATALPLVPNGSERHRCGRRGGERPAEDHRRLQAPAWATLHTLNTIGYD